MRIETHTWYRYLGICQTTHSVVFLTRTGTFRLDSILEKDRVSNDQSWPRNFPLNFAHMGQCWSEKHKRFLELATVISVIIHVCPRVSFFPDLGVSRDFLNFVSNKDSLKFRSLRWAAYTVEMLVVYPAPDAEIIKAVGILLCGALFPCFPHSIRNVLSQFYSRVVHWHCSSRAVNTMSPDTPY